MKKKKPTKKKADIKKVRKIELDGFLAYQMWKVQNQFGAEYDNLDITRKI